MPFKVNKSIIKGTKQHKDLAFKLVRKKLDKGIAGEANNDGSVFVSKDVPKGSALEAEVINHEADHMARIPPWSAASERNPPRFAPTGRRYQAKRLKALPLTLAHARW